MSASFFSSLASRLTHPWTTNYSSPSSPSSKQSTSTLFGEMPHHRDHGSSDQTLLCVFRILDQNRDGFLSVREICEGLHRLGVDIPHQQMSDLFSLTSSSGLLSFDQFESLYASLCVNSGTELPNDDDEEDATLGEEARRHLGSHERQYDLFHNVTPNPNPNPKPEPEQSVGEKGNPNPNIEKKNEDLLLLEAFGVYDKNADGFISLPELQTVLCGMGFAQCRDFAFCRKIMQRVDTNGDGLLDFSEFKNMMVQNDGEICHI